MFFPKAQELAHLAAEAEKAGEVEKASEYYLSVTWTFFFFLFFFGSDPR